MYVYTYLTNLATAFSTFLPTIITGINPKFPTPVVQVLTIPCYILGAVAYLAVGYISDKQQRRGVWVVLMGLVSVSGYIMLISDGGVGVHYAGCFLVAAGLYVVVGLPLAWLPTNVPRYGKRTTTIAMQAAIGNSAGIMSSFVSLRTPPPPFFPPFLQELSNGVKQLTLESISFVCIVISYVRGPSLHQGTCDLASYGSVCRRWIWDRVGLLHLHEQ